MFRSLNITVLLSLVGVVIGWLLSEASSIMRRRREQKKIYGRVLLRLFQLREMFEEEVSRAELAKVLRERGQLDTEHRRLLAEERKRGLLEFLKDSNEPLSDISTIDPVFSYELDRHMRGMTNVLTVSGAYADPPALDELNQFWESALVGGETVTLKFLITDIDKLLLKVARRQSLLSLVRTRRYFRRQRNLRRDYPKARLADHFVKMKEVNDTIAHEIKRRNTANHQ